MFEFDKLNWGSFFLADPSSELIFGTPGIYTIAGLDDGESLCSYDLTKVGIYCRLSVFCPFYYTLLDYQFISHIYS